VTQTRRSGPILAIVLVSYVMIVVDISIVITALPKIRHDVGFSATGLSWVQNAYTLAFGGLLLLGARAGDILGRRRMFVVGLGLFTAASLAVGIAQSPAWLLSARAAQGVGAAILAPSTLALLQTSFPEGRERTRAVAYYGSVAGIGASLGLVLGGALASWPSWRVGFFVNVPIGVALMLAAPRYLPESDRRRGRLDIAGAVSSTVGMTALVYGIVRSASAGWSDATTIAAIGAGVVLLALFVLNERRAAQPIMPLRLFANRERVGAYAGRFLYLGGMLGFWFFVTLYLQNVKGYSPVEAGIAFLPTTLPNFAAALAVPRLTRRFGNARLLVVGLAFTVVGMAWLGRVSADASFLTGVALPMVLIGLGQGACLAPLTSSGIAGVAGEDAGAASGVVNVSHQLGGSLGLGVLVAVFAAATGPGGLDPGQLAHGISVALTVAALILALALVVCVILIVEPGSGSRHGAESVAAAPPLPELPTVERSAANHRPTA
jgi:EmrB/QacA subfamily drug resistance transporter